MYGRLLVLERRELHRHVAETLADEAAERAAEVAFHYEAAGDAERAREFAERAAERAMALGALADARVHLRMALRVTWDAHERARQLAQLGTLEYAIGDMPAAIAAGREAAALYGETGDVPARAHALLDLSVSMLYNADRAGAMEVRRSVLELLEPLGESTELASAYRVLGNQFMLESAYEEAARWSRRAIDLGRRLGAEDVVQEATNDLGVAVCLAGDAENGLALLRSVLPATRGYVNYGNCLAHACRYEEAIAVSREGEAVCRRSGEGLRRRICQLNLAGCLRLTGAWEEAESVLVEILAEGEETGFRKYQLMGGLLELAPLRADQGRWGEALALCERFGPLARDREELQCLAPLHLTAARALAARGDDARRPRAARDLARALARTDRRRRADRPGARPRLRARRPVGGRAGRGSPSARSHRRPAFCSSRCAATTRGRRRSGNGSVARSTGRARCGWPAASSVSSRRARSSRGSAPPTSSRSPRRSCGAPASGSPAGPAPRPGARPAGSPRASWRSLALLPTASPTPTSRARW